jgi:hypothetical protein
MGADLDYFGLARLGGLAKQRNVSLLLYHPDPQIVERQGLLSSSHLQQSSCKGFKSLLSCSRSSCTLHEAFPF